MTNFETMLIVLMVCILMFVAWEWYDVRRALKAYRRACNGLDGLLNKVGDAIDKYAPEVVNVIKEAVKELAEKQKSEKKEDEDESDEEAN